MIGGAERAFIAENAPKHLLGTVLGLYGMLQGIGLLLASILAGVLWDTAGSGAPFLLGGALGILSALLIVLITGGAKPAPRRNAIDRSFPTPHKKEKRRMNETMQLVLLRHGESEWNKENLFTGWMDVGLSDNGRQQASAAGQRMRQLGIEFDLCYTSYLKRAIHTLHLALEAMDREWLPVMKSWKLNERHYGALQGLNKAETAEKYGDEQVFIWRRSFDVRPAAAFRGRRP